MPVPVPVPLALGPLRLSLVVPTFNEIENIEELMRRLDIALAGIAFELIVVDDDSPDATARRVRELAVNDRRVRCVHRIGRRGLSSACVEGMLASAAPVIAVMDADLQHDEAILPRLLEPLEAGLADVAVATRYAAGGGIGEWDQRRAMLSRVATSLAQRVLRQPVSDPMSGFFALRRDVLDASVRSLSAIGFKILLDLLASSPKPPRVVEVPYQFRPRLAGQSKLDETVVWEYGMLLLDKAVGRWVPVRFLAFAAVGGVGVLVHMALLGVLLHGVQLGFTGSQALATTGAMLFNFALNNVLTYRDKRLQGLAWWRGLLAFMAVCAVGAAANVGIATYLFEGQVFNGRSAWFLAALSGVLVSAVWNYAATAFYTWGRARPKATRRGAP